jgi:anionic cell wall polymer biosynthesis LytR-Cps2A-Psr (LCP) family protein
MSDREVRTHSTVRGPDDDRYRFIRRGPGSREQRLRESKRHKRRRTLFSAFLAWLLVGALVSAYIYFDPFAGADRDRGGTDPLAVAPAQEAWLIIGTLERNATGPADWLAVLAWDFDAEKGIYLYIPRSTLVEIPGFGRQVVSDARALSGEPLQISAVSNLLGVQFDHFLRISDQGIRALFDEADGVTIDVPTRVTRTGEDGRIQTVFATGEQPLNGQRAADYLAYVDASGDELTRSIRHSLVWEGLFEKFRAANPAGLGQLFSDSTDLFVTDADAGEVAGFFGKLASSSDFAFETLPVEAVGIDAGAQLYRTDTRTVERLVASALAGVRPLSAGEPGRRVQVLNGNGVPGIGEQVAAVLVPEGFRIVLNANAKRFNYQTTEIVVYSDAESALEIGREVRAALGVGRIVVSRQQQSLVDVTIVIGKDFLDRSS